MHASWAESDSSQDMVQDGNIEVDLCFGYVDNTVWKKINKIKIKKGMLPLLIWLCIIDVGGNPGAMLSFRLLCVCPLLWPIPPEPTNMLVDGG